MFWEKALFSSVLGYVLEFHIFEIFRHLGDNCGDFMYLFTENMNFGLWTLANIMCWDVLGFGIFMY